MTEEAIKKQIEIGVIREAIEYLSDKKVNGKPITSTIIIEAKKGGLSDARVRKLLTEFNNREWKSKRYMVNTSITKKYKLIKKG